MFFLQEHDGLPDVTKLALIGRDQHTMLICDDLSYLAYASKSMSLLFSNISNHEKISVLIATQNMFPNEKHRRNIAVNLTHYLILRDMGKFL